MPVLATALETKLVESVERVTHQVFRSDGMDKNKATPRKAVEMLLQRHPNGLISANHNGAMYNIRDDVDFEHRGRGKLELLVCHVHFIHVSH